MALPQQIRNGAAQDNAFSNRCTAELSDGNLLVGVYDDANSLFKIYYTADRVNFSLKISFACNTSCVSMAVEKTGDHVQIVGQYLDDSNIIWARYTRSGSTWSISGTTETVVSGADSIGSVDIDTLDTAGACAVAYKKFSSTNEMVAVKARGSAGTWSTEQTAYSAAKTGAIAFDPVFVVADKEGVVSSKQRIFWGGMANRGLVSGGLNKFFMSTATFHTGTGAYQSDKHDSTYHATDLNWQSLGIYNKVTAFQGEGNHELYLVMGRYYNGFYAAVTSAYVTFDTGTNLFTTTMQPQQQIPHAWGKAPHLAFAMVDIGSTYKKLAVFTTQSGSNIQCSVYDWNAKTWLINFPFTGTLFIQTTRILAGSQSAGTNKVSVIFEDAAGDTWHDHNQSPASGPTAPSPVNGATVDTDTPVLSAKPSTMQVSGFPRKLRFDIANNSGFSSSHKTEYESDAVLDNLSPHSHTLSDANQLDQSLKYFKSYTVDPFGGESAASATTQFTVSHPPLAIHLDPAGGTVIDFGSGDVDFNWEFSDASPVDTQTAYQIEIRQSLESALTHDTGKVSSIDPTATITLSTLFEKDIDLIWRVKLWDRDDVSGAFSDYAAFKAGDAPDVTIDSPTLLEVIDRPRPLVAWTYTGDRVQQAYRVTFRLTDSPFTEVHDSGWKNGDDVDYRLPAGILKNTKNYTVDVQVRDTWKLIGEDTQLFSTAWTPPDNPIFLIQPDLDLTGHVTITWTDASEDADFVSYKVLRRLTGLTEDTDYEVIEEFPVSQPTYEFDDWFVQANVSYDYLVIQVANRFGEPTDGDIETPLDEVLTSEHYWLIPEDTTLAMRLDQITGDDFTEDYEEAEILILDRGRRKEFGTRWGYSGSLTAEIWDTDTRTARASRLMLEALKAEKIDVTLRNPFGDLFTIAMGAASISRIAGTGTREFHTLTLPYSEVS